MRANDRARTRRLLSQIIRCKIVAGQDAAVKPKILQVRYDVKVRFHIAKAASTPRATIGPPFTPKWREKRPSGQGQGRQPLGRIGVCSSRLQALRAMHPQLLTPLPGSDMALEGLHVGLALLPPFTEAGRKLFRAEILFFGGQSGLKGIVTAE